MNRLAGASAALLLVAVAACGDGSDPASAPSSSDGTAPTSAPAPATSEASPTTTSGTSSTTTSGTSSTTTEPIETEIVSDDGAVTLEVPFGAVPDPSAIAIRVLEPEEYPPGLAGAAANPGTVLYGLEPAGTVFSEPARITRRIPAGNFANVPANGIPLITLLVAGADGTTFEMLPGAEIVRDGAELLVRGEVSHFSTLVSIYESQYAVIDTHLLGDELATEVGTPLVADAGFFSDDGTPLTGTVEVAPSGWTGSDQVEFLEPGASTSLRVTCKATGEFRIGLRYDLTLLADADTPADTPALRATPTLTGDRAPSRIRYKLAAPLTCLDPATALTGRSARATVGTDHPGGQVLIPNADFRGGRSGLFGVIALDPGITLDDPLIGIIEDTNRNGTVDGSDSLHAPGPATAQLDGLGFVAPLFRWGDYFVFVLDGSEFEGGLSGTTSVADGLADLHQMYGGDGRFETSIALLGSGGMPFVHTVGSDEGTEEVDGELLVFVTPQIVEGE